MKNIDFDAQTLRFFEEAYEADPQVMKYAAEAIQARRDEAVALEKYEATPEWFWMVRQRRYNTYRWLSSAAASSESALDLAQRFWEIEHDPKAYRRWRELPQ